MTDSFDPTEAPQAADRALARRAVTPVAVPAASVPVGSLQEALALGDVLARTGYFKDVRDAGQAVAKILYGQELGITPMAAMMGIHIIEGKPSPSATLMATLIKRSGRYNYRVVEWTATACRIAFTERGEPCGEASFTIQEAQAANVANKQVWKAYPKAMLFARALSQGARTFCADVFGGAPVYSAEELDAPADVTASGDVVYRAVPTPAPPDRVVVDVRTGEVLDGPAVARPPDLEIDPAPARPDQVAAIVKGFELLGFDDATRAAWLKPYRVPAVHQLSVADATALHTALQNQYKAQRAAMGARVGT